MPLLCLHIQQTLLQDIFDSFIDSYIENKIGISNSFLSEALALQLKVNLEERYKHQFFKPAGIGNDETVNQNKTIRSDKIYWLDRSQGNEAECIFFDLIDTFTLHLNTTCFTGITGYEFHYALYEAGSFYSKHLDQFRNNSSRQFSMIMYLNENWLPGDGGELCIHQNNTVQNIAPEMGTSVFFKSSELLHEVLVTNKLRMSITGWLKI